MDCFQIRIPETPTTTKPITIVPVSDTHFGSIAHDHQSWERVKTFIKETPSCYWICLGDMGEFIPPGDRRYDGKLLNRYLKNRAGDIITATIDLIVEEFSPIKDKLLLMLSGNHDDKYRKTVGVDIVAIIAERLGIKQNSYPYEALVKLFFGKKSRFSASLYLSHGFGGGLYKGNKLNRLSLMSKNFDADIYIAGHAHDMMAAPERVVSLNLNGTSLIEKTRWLIRIAGFRKSRSDASDYEEKAGYPPNVTGTVAIEFFRRGDNLDANVRFLT